MKRATQFAEKTIARKVRMGCLVVCFACLVFPISAQILASKPVASQSASAQVPHLIKFSGVAKDETGKATKGVTGITFSLYKDEQGGTPLWMETQNVQPDSGGHYTVLLGSNTSTGIPVELFGSGEAQWLGAQVQGQAEQPRVLMVSVPYALKAEDAETIGGLPPSAFVMANQTAGQSARGNVAGATTATPGHPQPPPPCVNAGTVNRIAKFSSATCLNDSIMYQTAVGIGVGVPTPTTKLDVDGGLNILAGSSFNIGTKPFAFGSFAHSNAFLGFAGNSTMTGTFNTASGMDALFSNTSGNYNTANGNEALVSNTSGNSNTASGMDALFFNTTGNSNTANGSQALQSNTTGVSNTASGTTALFSNSKGNNNTAAGLEALYSNSTGSDNTASGTIALYSNSTGNYNTAAGFSALTNNTTGSNNTALGYNAGPDSASTNLTNSTAIGANAVVSASNSLVLGGTGANAVKVGISTATPAFTLDVEGTGVVNVGTSFNLGGQPFAYGSYANQNAFLGFSGNFTTTGIGNSATGYQALLANTTGYGNVASGYQALFANTTGQTNTASGFQALYSNTSGVGNTGDGNGALLNNTTGGFNTASGRGALYYNSTGSYNTGLGVDALAGNTTGSYNTACGMAMESNNTGSYNTACGVGALTSNSSGGGSTAFGFEALEASTSGSYNTANGDYALYSNITGNYNTALGYNAGPDSASTNLTNATAIGANAVVSQSNALILGAPGVNVGIGTAIPSNVFTIAQNAGQAISDGWTTYSSRRWKTNIHTLQGALVKVERLRGVSYDLKASGKHEVGVIAEEVGAVVPEVVAWEKNGKDAQGVDYSRLTALLIEATKEQQVMIRKQQAQIKIQQSQIDTERKKGDVQRAELGRLTSRIKAIQATLERNGVADTELRTAAVHLPAVAR